MNYDISGILEGWEYRPGEIIVRKIMGRDGREKIQLRIDLGLLQMETTGKPDGKRPYGEESWLDHYLTLVENHRAMHGSDDGFRLSREDCAKLQLEALQYYHRRISFLELEDYEGAQRDAEHNLRLFELVKRHAVDDRDKMALEQYRAFVLMHWTRSVGMLALQKKDYDEALRRIEEGIQKIEDFFREYDRSDLIEVSREIAYLRTWAEEIRKGMPVSLEQELREQLQLAIEREEYEKAAQIRDRLRGLVGR